MTTVPLADVPVNGEGETIPMQTRSKHKIDDNILNHELRRKLWEGMIPLKIELSLNDTHNIKRPSSLYVRFCYKFCLDYGSATKLLVLST